MRPTALLLGKDDRKRMSKWDIVLMEAHNLLSAERCHQCGLPRWICNNASNDIDFRMEKEVCFATQAKQKYEDTQEKKRSGRKGKAGEAPVGEAVTPVPYLRSGEPLSTLREPFWEEYNRTQEQIRGSH